MRRLFITFLLLISITGYLFASPALPTPIQVTQPDGSTITIQIHGDEFLNWVTCDGSLVVAGDDGYYYYATFDAEGNSISTGDKVSTGGLAPKKAVSVVTPPTSAVELAKQRRNEVFGNNQTKIFKAPSSSPPSKSISIGTNKRYLVLLVDFKDVRFSTNGGGDYARTSFYNMLNQEGYSINGGTGSVRDYYSQNSLNKFTPRFDVVGPITVSQNLTYYSVDKGHNQNPGTPSLLVEACQLADSQIDFSQYDNDENGYIDNVFLIFAGYNSAEGAPNTIWPHKWSVNYDTFYFDGKRLNTYACGSEFTGTSGSEMVGIGTFAHEFGHVLGLPDLYDIDDEINGDGEGLGKYSLMSSGNYNNSGKTPPHLNCEERYLLGWMSESDITLLSNTNTLTPIQSGKAQYSPTNNQGEYYMYEFRNGQNWDNGLEQGLYIYHIDQSNNIVTQGVTALEQWQNRTINTVAAHPCFDLIEAGEFNVAFGNSKNSFDESTNPAAVDWAGNTTGYNLKNISYTSSNVSFLCNNNLSVYGHVYDKDGNPISGAIISITFETAPSNIVNKMFSKSFNLSPMKTPKTSDVLTGSDGYFEIEMEESVVGQNCILTASKSGYLSSNKEFTFETSSNFDLYLHRPNIEYDATLKKNSGENALYYTIPGTSFYVGMNYMKNELSSYSNYRIDDVSLYLRLNKSNAQVTLFIEDNGERLLTKDITSSINNSGWTVIDIKDHNIRIAPNNNLLIGYSITGTSLDGARFYSDDEPTIDGGGLYSYDGTSWDQIGHNFLISANLSYDKSSIIDASGINYIQKTKSTYSEGDKFVLTVVNSSVKKYTDISWTVNSESKSDGSIITLEKGVTEIKATLTFASGRSEVLIIYIKVE